MIDKTNIIAHDGTVKRIPCTRCKKRKSSAMYIEFCGVPFILCKMCRQTLVRILQS